VKVLVLGREEGNLGWIFEGVWAENVRGFELKTMIFGVGFWENIF
jgi:hypothetical protein